MDGRLTATLEDLRPLLYAGGSVPDEDQPAHVRAASAVRRFAQHLLVVQDDANALAVIGPDDQAEPILLPRGAQGRRLFDDVRGNKGAKLDLEACAALPDGRLVVFGSGSTQDRETLFVVDPDRRFTAVSAAPLYAALRAEPRFSGSELNLEGALVLGDELWLVQRGNGAPIGELAPVDALGALSLGAFLRWIDDGGTAPRLLSVTQVELGALGGCRLTLTDAAPTAGGGLALLACAERSPDAITDGPVEGCCFALYPAEAEQEVRLAPICTPNGALATRKLEGLEARPDEAGVFDVVVDMDRPDEPAQIGRLLIADAS